jgi:uncharacterized protein YgbK (DUF1537 family)
MKEPIVDRQQLLAALPSESVEHDVRALVDRVNRKVIVLDDDPTGTQTVHGVPVVTGWTVEQLRSELLDPGRTSYVLTNSRSMDEKQAVTLNREVAHNLCTAARETQRDFVVISRSDSTLRGHFPAEMDALESSLDQVFDAWVVCPFFEAGGRLTIGDVHYVAEDERLIPAAQTPFARDASFGYEHSNLREWVQEKSHGRFASERITSLSIDELRSADTSSLVAKLTNLSSPSVCIVNAATASDLMTATRVLLEAEAVGRRFLYRTAASFVATRSAVSARPLLAADELACDSGRGVLIVVGSHVPKTTSQLQHLLERVQPTAVEIEVARLEHQESWRRHLEESAERASRQLDASRTVVVYTSRQLFRPRRVDPLAVGKQVSRGLVEVVRRLRVRPRVIIAKGGITASDLATEACALKRAIVLGQVLPGIPVWRCGPESRFPKLPLVVFPGNVGSAAALTEVVQRCL